jgi:hypothetical protein
MGWIAGRFPGFLFFRYPEVPMHSVLVRRYLVGTVIAMKIDLVARP